MTTVDGAPGLPPGWAYATIGELIPPDGVFIDGDWVESKDQDPNGDIRLVQLADIGDGFFVDKSDRHLTKTKAYELACTFLKKGDVLVARMPDPLGRCCIFPLIGAERYVTVVDVCVIRLSDFSADPKYLMHLINSPEIRIAIADLQSGSTRKRISRGNLAKIRLPIAPLNEQRQIVAKIEEVFSELDKGVEALKIAREQLNAYRQSVLKHAFAGKLTEAWRSKHPDKTLPPDAQVAALRAGRDLRLAEAFKDWQKAILNWQLRAKSGPKPTRPHINEVIGNPEIPDELLEHCTGHWAWLRLGDISEVTGGLTKNPKRSVLPVSMKYLRVANVYADRLELDEVTEIGVTEDEFECVKLKQGDLLVVEGNGSVDQIGRVAMWGDELDDVGHQNHLIRVRLSEGMSPRFFVSFLMSPLGRDLIVRQASSTSGLHTLSISKVSALPVPVPSQEEQEALLRALAAPMSEIEKLGEEIDTGLAKCAALRQVILKGAFSGQLVRQNPEDEPAVTLLERIRAERECAATKKGRATKNGRKEAA